MPGGNEFGRVDIRRGGGVFQCPHCRGSLDIENQRCAGCGLRFEAAGPVVDFVGGRSGAGQQQIEIELHRSLAAEYENRYQPEFARLYSRYWNRQFLEHLPASPGLVLDCGCGTGELSRALQSLAGRVMALDISREMILRALQQEAGSNRIIWVVSPAETFPFADNRFDAVCFRGALHHMADPLAGLREAHRVLKPGGRLLLSEPNDDSLLLRLPRRLANRYLARFGNDHKAFRSGPWLAAIRRFGFSVITTKYFSFFSQPLCGMSDLLPLMRHLPGASWLAGRLVSIDEFLSRLPGIRRQSFDLFVAAEKRNTFQANQE